MRLSRSPKDAKWNEKITETVTVTALASVMMKALAAETASGRPDAIKETICAFCTFLFSKLGWYCRSDPE